MTVDLTADPSAHADDDRDRTTRARSAEAASPEAAASPGPVGTPDPHASMPTTGRYAGHLHFDETITPVLRTDFDVEAYTKRGTSRIAVDTELLGSQEPLRDQERLALGVLHRMESSGLAEARTMLSTVTANEARITAFLATWLVDRHWQARALRDLLTGDHPVERPAPSRRPSRVAALRRIHVDRVQPLLTPLWNAAAGEPVAAGHMARMAIQEASLVAGLDAIARRLGGEAERVVRTVRARQEAAVDFFTQEAIGRITRSRKEAVVARLVLSLSSPLHGGGVPDPDLDAALQVLGADPRDRAGLQRARREITRLLPGPDLPDAHLLSLPRSGA